MRPPALLSTTGLPLRALRALAAFLAFGGFLWLVYLGLTWDLRSSAAEGDAAFERVAVERGDLRHTVAATGTTEPLARVVVQSEIPGIVARVFVDDGERVARGDPLVELDREPLVDRVGELRAALAHRRALTRVDLEGRAHAELARARRDLARAERLHGSLVTSETQLDDARYAVAIAEIGAHDAAAELAARRAAADEAAQALSRAERDLEKAVIRAPVDGVVLRREVEVGTAVADLQNGGTVVAVLADDSVIHLLAEVDENDVAGVALGQSADVRVDAFPDEVFRGTVRKIAASGTASGSVAQFEVEIEIEADARIRVGMSADARIVVGVHRDALLLPNTALVRTTDGPRARVPLEGRRGFDLRPVDEVYSDGFRTAIRESARGGDVAWAEGTPVLVRADASPDWQP